jgi:hypothetical protein
MESAFSARGAGGPLDVGGIIATSVAIWPRLMLAFGPIYALQVLPGILPGQLGGPPDAHGGGVVLQAPLSQEQLTALLTICVADLVGLLISLVCLGALVAVVTQVLDGGQPRIMAAIGVGLRRFFPVMGACGYAGLLMLLGFILLIVPGFIATAWYFLVVPVCVLERLGPGASLRRSAALSKGVRWRLFALFLVMVGAGLVATACSSVAESTIGGLGEAAVDLLAATSAGIFAGTVPVVAYRALVGARPRIGQEDWRR